MAEYTHGEMNITEQTKTYDGFTGFATRCGIACIALAVFLAIFHT